MMNHEQAKDVGQWGEESRADVQGEMDFKKI